ncbi:MAG: hypothetical protein ACRDV4_10885, partial [Acidimicrobiales bacterium]
MTGAISPPAWLARAPAVVRIVAIGVLGALAFGYGTSFAAARSSSPAVMSRSEGAVALRTGAVSGHATPTNNLGLVALASPVRIADTRASATDPSTYAGETLGPGDTLTIDLPSSDVPSDVGAVVGQLTAVAPTKAGFLSAYPAGATNPGTASVNFGTGQIVGNFVTVGTGTDPKNGAPAITVYNGPSGKTDFTFDLYGYYSPATSSSGDPYFGLAPQRIFDTRSASGLPGQGQTLTGGATAKVPVTGVGGVPSSGVSAVVVNIAVTNTTALSYLQAYPSG